ncbi:MAG: hypothetical protein JXM73_07540 [Anaerolineae bacterium]|nr:hypothetical protein [Anaerolineae bacterium]
MGEEQLQILKMLEEGQVGAEEAAELLAALRPGAAESPRDEGWEGDGAMPGLERAAPLAAEPAAAPGWERPPVRWSRFWIYPALAGGGLLIVGAVVLGLLYAASAAPGWRVCGWLPMILGLVVAILAWWSRNARWLHLRIKEKGERNIAFSFPLPLTLTAWVVRLAQRFVPQLKETGVDEMILALRDANRDEPFFLDVQDSEDGEHVQVYIG